MRKVFLLVLWIAGLSAVNAQEYNVAFIPDSLKVNANSVKRFEETTLEIKSTGKAKVHHKLAMTILNSKGDREAYFVGSYNKLVDLSEASGNLYDALGKELKHMKKKDMKDQSGTSEMTLMTDTRYKICDFDYHSYPFTVMYEWEEEYNGIRGFPDWYPQSSHSIGVQSSKFNVIAPKDYSLRFKPVNCKINPSIGDKGDNKTYTWEVKNLVPRVRESFEPAWEQIAPIVLFAPSDFEAEGYKGNMSSWLNYGKFIYDLLQNRDMLPDDVKRKVHELTDQVRDVKEKIYLLYDYIQKTTRYISVQLGIGGLQPFDAKYVATNKYGDCKALSNYMVALLKEAGIKGNSVSILSGAGNTSIQEDFPSHQFNHRIACVPINKDTIWLECTSQTVSAGFMGSFTGDRKALLVDESGGYLVSTPKYTSADNLQSRKVQATIDSAGNLSADVNTLFRAILSEETSGLMHEVSKEDREKYLNAVINLPTYSVDKSEYKEEKGALPVVKEYLHITSNSYASITGKRLFIQPNLFNKSAKKLKPAEKRENDIVNDEVYTDIDSIEIVIPAGYIVESMPKDVIIKSKFGNYSIVYTVAENKIYLNRFHEVLEWHFTPKDYADLVKYYDDIFKADRNKIVFVKKEG